MDTVEIPHSIRIHCMAMHCKLLFWIKSLPVLFCDMSTSTYFESISNITIEDDKTLDSSYYCDKEKLSLWTVFLVLSALGFTGVICQDILMDITRFRRKAMQNRQKRYEVMKIVAKVFEWLVVWLPVYFVVFSDYIGDWMHTYCVVN